jgi:hypothetical protein
VSYRPICDVWLMGRPKVKYYGAYPCGFLLRARDLLGVHPLDSVLHVCSGMVRDYSDPKHGVCPGVPVEGFGVNDKTLDIDPLTNPDFLHDAREPFPSPEGGFWPAILLDPPYTEEDAAHYRCGKSVLPSTGILIKHALAAVRPGGKIGILHYLFPKPPKGVRLVAKISVNHGFNNRDRCYTVFQRPLETTP